MIEPVSPDDLAAILKREFDAADDYHGHLADIQEASFRYYEAQPFGNEVDGRSQIVLPDVQEACDYMQQSVMRTFVSGDYVVEFEATDEESEQYADEATQAIDYKFMREHDGYGTLNDACADGLVKKIGVFKTCCEESEKVSREWARVTADQLGLIEGGVEIENLRENEDGTFNVLFKRQRTEKKYTGVAVPVGEFRFSPRARHEDDADYLAHVRAVTRSDLVEMGFDRDQVDNLPGVTREVMERASSSTLDTFRTEESTKALEEVLLCEEYARIDVDGDGIAERVKAYRVENEILIDAETGKPSIETIDEQPFAVFSPFPRPHLLVGYSLADKVMDLQLARSYVARQLFDGMAFANMPRPVVTESGSSDETLDDLLSPIPGSPIRVRSLDAVTSFGGSFDVGASLSAMEWLTGERESRTGITRLNQGLDADALNKTATGTALMQSQGQQFEEYIARNLAETVARLFGKLYRLMRVEAEPFSIRVDGKYRRIDPSMWPESMNIRVRVGLGSGSKDKRVQARMALMQPLTLAVEQGLASAEHVFKWFDGVARDTGVGRGEDFMFDPSSEEGQAHAAQRAEQPDPAMAEAQAKIALEREKASANVALDRDRADAAAQLERDKASAAIDTDRQKHAMQMQAMREKAALEAELARDKAGAEIELARWRIEQEAALKREFAEVSVSQNRPGGSLAE